MPKGKGKETDATGNKPRETTANKQSSTPPRKMVCGKKKKQKKNEEGYGNKVASHHKKTRKVDEDDGSSDDGVFPSIGGPCPEFGLPYWSYDLDTEIKDLLSGNTFKIRDVVEGRVDSDGFPITNKANKRN